LEEYLEGVGGKEKVMADYYAKKSEAGGKGKKRGRASTDAEPNGSAPKRGRGRKNGVHPGSTTPPASAGEFKPPTGNWEEQIVAIDACEGGEGNVVVYLTWKGGHKTQHPLSQVYKRCPQRVRPNIQYLAFLLTKPDA
jgi:chromobox protein 1